MRYLRKFNENIFISENNIDELTKFSEQYLAYLLDDGFKLIIEISKGNKETTINLVKIDDDNDENSFNWIEIKDSFIPYITILNENYNIKDEINFDLDLGIKFLPFFTSVNNIINDEMETLKSDKYGEQISTYTAYYNNLSECDILSIEIIIINN